jgi:hypothetical protein
LLTSGIANLSLNKHRISGLVNLHVCCGLNIVLFIIVRGCLIFQYCNTEVFALTISDFPAPSMCFQK